MPSSRSSASRISLLSIFTSPETSLQAHALHWPARHENVATKPSSSMKANSFCCRGQEKLCCVPSRSTDSCAGDSATGEVLSAELAGYSTSAAGLNLAQCAGVDCYTG